MRTGNMRGKERKDNLKKYWPRGESSIGRGKRECEKYCRSRENYEKSENINESNKYGGTVSQISEVLDEFKEKNVFQTTGIENLSN